MRKIFYLAFALVLSLQAIAQKKSSAADLEDLKNRMIGSFSSSAQSKSDSSYFDIRLHMSQIWDKNKDGYWLYVEQAVATSLAKPYRQRIYHVYQQNDSTFISKVFEIKDPLRFAGAWATTEEFNNLTVDSLIDRQGCAITLRKNDQGDFVGSTPGKECLSSLRGASYASSEVIIQKDRLLSWDRGWNKDDKQVWGAVKGGYQFIKE